MILCRPLPTLAVRKISVFGLLYVVMWSTEVFVHKMLTCLQFFLSRLSAAWVARTEDWLLSRISWPDTGTDRFSSSWYLITGKTLPSTGPARSCNTSKSGHISRFMPSYVWTVEWVSEAWWILEIKLEILTSVHQTTDTDSEYSLHRAEFLPQAHRPKASQ